MELTHSEYFNMLLTLDAHNTQAGTTICAMYGCSFVSGCDMNMLQMSPFYTTVCEYTKCVWMWGCVHPQHLPFSISVWAGIVGTIVMEPTSWVHSYILIFWKPFCWGCLKMRLCEKEVVVLAQHNCSTQWARCPAVVKIWYTTL
jgi:hypothetical protein